MTVKKEKQTSKRKLLGEIPEQELLEGGFVAISKSTLELLLGNSDYAKITPLYMFYLYTAKWQNNWSIRATTGYTSKAVGMGIDSVIKHKKKLIDLGLIEDIQRRNDKGAIEGHYIKICKPQSKLAKGGEIQGEEKVETNTISNNINTISNILNSTPPVKQEGGDIKNTTLENNIPPKLTLPLPQGFTTPSSRAYAIYQYLSKKKYGICDMVNIGRDKAILKRLEGTLGEYKLALAIILFMEWKGADGQDQFITKLLGNSCHSLLYLQKQITPILAYAQNNLKITDDNLVATINNKLTKFGLCQKES